MTLSVILAMSITTYLHAINNIYYRNNIINVIIIIINNKNINNDNKFQWKVIERM